MVETIGLLIGRDMCIAQPGFFTIGLHIGFLQADLPSPNGLNLAALQRHPGFKGFYQKIFEFRLAIGGDDLDVIHAAILPQLFFDAVRT